MHVPDGAFSLHNTSHLIYCSIYHTDKSDHGTDKLWPGVPDSIADVSVWCRTIDMQTDLIYVQFTIWSGLQWEGGDCSKEPLMERKRTQLKQIRVLVPVQEGTLD